MPNKLLQFFLFAGFFLFGLTAIAQPALWTTVDKASFRGNLAAANLVTGSSVLSKLNLTALRSLLKSAPMEDVNGRTVNGTPLILPIPGGTVLRTSVVESPVWNKDRTSPNVKTYVLVNPATNSLDGRITVTAHGISGILFTNEGVAYIDPLQKDNQMTHIIYRTNQVKMDAAPCISNGPDALTANTDGRRNESRTAAGDCKMRTYRLAVAATGEYTKWAGGQAGALDYITIAINNVMAIFERDLNIRFALVTTNDIIFTDSLTDPYTGPTTANWQIPASNANQTALDNILGNNGYDVGIVFNKGWGAGYAPTGVVCKATEKGKSAAGISNGQGLNPVAGPQGFVFDYTVAHEIGHLFGASHTFASNAGFCAPYGNAATAYEPGAGSSLMTYATYATCGSFVNYIEPYFHAGSIAQIRTYLGTTSCGTVTTSGNAPPAITVAASAYHLPVSTPFTLAATGTDADGNKLLYNWEQMDPAFTATPPPGTNTTGPNFRSYPPATDGNIRTFPRIQDVAANVNTPYEKLTSVSRTMNFRVTARDQSAIGPCTDEADVAVSFYNSAGPFTVTSQAANVTWVANGSNTQSITWNVANTNVAPVNCTAVNILFSVNGGITYPYKLVSNTANDGSEVITVPNISTQSGRIKIEPVNNIFFNINKGNITITGTCNAEGSEFTPGDEISAVSGSASLNLALTPQYGTAFTPTGTITASNPSSLLPIFNNSIPSCAVYGFNGSFKYNVHPFVVSTPGTYSFNIPSPAGRVFNLYRDAYNPAFPCYNFIASNTVTGNAPTTINPTMSANLVPGNRYVLVVGTFSEKFPALPANYTVTVSGGSIYTNPVSPGAAFDYLYVVVDNATNIIKSIASTANLSNSATYPGGTGYSVYGLSYSNSSPSLASFVGGTLNSLTNAIFNDPSYCGSIAQNILKVNVTTRYTFTGNGNWSNPANWSNNSKPPAVLPSGIEIVINHASGGECILDVPVTFTTGVKLTVSPGKTFRVLGD